MDFAITPRTRPAARRVLELAARAEALGFDGVWTFDSHILWQEPYVIQSQILAATERIMVGPLVTDPATRIPGAPRPCSRRSTTCSATARSAASAAATPRSACSGGGRRRSPSSTTRW